MADTEVADAPNAPPLEITITPKQTFAPDIASEGATAAPIRPVGQDAGVGVTDQTPFGDTYMKLAQLQQGRAAREALDKLTAGEAKPVRAGEPETPPPATAPGAPTGALARSLGSRLLDGSWDVAKDVGRGSTQLLTRSLPQGVGEAFRQTAEAGDHLATWLNDHVVDLTIPVPLTGISAVDQTIANPIKAIGKAAGKIADMGEKPDTVTSGIAKDVIQFLTGMAIGGKVLKGAGVGVEGFQAFMAKGAFSDFVARDPDAKKLADLVQAHPDLANPVSQFLQAKPDDNEAVKRLKAATEGAGMGVLSEGFVLGVKAVRAGMHAARAAGGHPEILQKMNVDAEARYGKMSEEAMALLGDPKAPLVKAVTPGQKASVAAKKLETAQRDMASGQNPDTLAAGLVKTTDAGGKEIYVNLARIEGEADVKKVIALMADAGKDRINLRRGGEKVTFAEMKKTADAMGMDMTDLLSRRAGTPMSAGEAIAARNLLTASGERLTELAKGIAGGTGTKTEEFLFRRQMAVHAAIQSEVIAARTETARALASWRIPAGGGIDASKSVFDALEAMGGSATTKELATRLALLNASGKGMGAVSDFVRKGVTARTIDAAMEAWKSAMLSGPTTHLSNIFSNTLMMGVEIGERKVGSMLSNLRGTVDGVAEGEANAMAHGLVESSKDAFRMAYMAMKTGESQFGRTAGKADHAPVRALSKEALGLPDNVWGNSIDYIGKGFNIPYRFLTAEDEFFKTMTFRMELHAQAQRVAQAEGLAGAKASARMREIIDNPPEAVKLAAQDFALASTFNRELTGALAKVAQARGSDGTIGRAFQFVFPFFRTPVNVFSASVERSPLAPLTAQFRADFLAGGARQDLALARMATGTTIMLVAADLADQGVITGMIAKDPGAKEARDRQSIAPYSVKLGGKWVNYNRLDPIAMPLAVAANMAELARRFEIEPDKLDSVREIMAAGIGGTAKAALDRSFMQGIAGLISAIEDPEGHSDQYMKQTIAGLVTPAISNTAAQLADPVKRETFDAIDAIEARIVELSKTLIPRIDLWGRDVRLAESGAGRAFDVISPLKVESERPNPIDAELVRLNYFPKRIDKKGSWDGAPVEFSKFPEVYAEYARLAGNALKLPQYEDKGAMDFLNDLVEGKTGYTALWKMLTDGPEGGKAMGDKFSIKKVIEDYRKAARQQIDADPRFSEFHHYTAQQATDKAVKKAPTQPERDVAPMIPRGSQMTAP